MQPQLTNLSPYMQPVSLTDEKARELRGHSAAREVATAGCESYRNRMPIESYW